MSKENNKVELEGVMDEGYGLIPKKVMKDPGLTIESKAIYSFIASYSGAGKTKEAFPSVDWICSKLGISRNRFYKHRKLLIDKDYIRIRQQKKGTEWANNIYTLTSVPRIQFRDTQNGDTQNGDTQNEYTISNSSIINSFISNSKDSPDSAKAKYDDDSPYIKLANRLEKHILNNNPNYKFRHKKQTWADDFRKIVELDDRDMKEVVGVLDWCQQDDFWHKNILSPSKFRDQYDKLVMNMPNKNNTNHNFQPSTDEDKYGWKDQIPI